MNLDADGDFFLLGVKKSLYGLAERLMGLHESVAEKRAEVDKMRRERRLFSVVNVQVRGV